MSYINKTRSRAPSRAPQSLKPAGNDPKGEKGARVPKAPYVYVTAQDNVVARALLDTGNLFATVISEEFLKRLPKHLHAIKPTPHLRVATAKKKEELTVLGRTVKPLLLRFKGHPTKFAVRPVVLRGLAMSMNLGYDFMKKADLVVLPKAGQLRIQGRHYPLPFTRDSNKTMGSVYVSKKTTIPPNSMAMIGAMVTNGPKAEGLIEGIPSFFEKTGLIPWSAALQTADHKGLTKVGVINVSNEPIHLPKGVQYGSFTPVGGKDGIHVMDHPKTKRDNKPQQWFEGPTTTKNRERRLREIFNVFKIHECEALTTKEERAAAAALLLKHWHAFSWDGKPGYTTLIQHRIHLKKGTKPVRSACRPVNPHLEDKLKEVLDTWKRNGIIVPSTSEWASPLVLVAKKDGKLRVCVDFRRLNINTLRDNYDIGNVLDLLARLGGSCIFSVMDSDNAFLNVGMHKSSQHLTAFVSPFGCHEFTRMPFGLTGAPQTYARLVQRILEGIPYTKALPFLDDCCVHSRTLPDHFSALDDVFAAYTKAGIKLKPTKCTFFAKRVKYLGHYVTPEGVQVDPNYIKAVQQWPMPTTRRQTRIFLGKASYYRRFIKGYQTIANPLTEKLKQDGTGDNTPFQPTDEQRKSFQTLKEALSQAPILALPDFTPEASPFILDTDFSADNAAIGAVLSQKQDKRERALLYHSLKLMKSQKTYNSFKGELFAGLTFMKRLKYYLTGKKFIWRTDFSALTQVKTMEAPNGLIGRWLEALGNFDFDVVHRAGKSHGNADSLSRAEHTDENITKEEAEDHHDSITIAALIAFKPETLTDWKTAQENDEDLSWIRKLVRTSIPPTAQETKTKSRQAQTYVGLLKTMKFDENGILRLEQTSASGSPRQTIIIPDDLKDVTIKSIHESSGHRGRDETTKRALKFIYFPRMTDTVTRVIAECTICQSRKPQNKPQKGLLEPTSAGYPFQKLSIDFVGPMATGKGGYRYIFTALDPFSRWLEAFPVKRANAKTAITKLHKEVFTRFGLPEQIHSDRGGPFVSADFKDFLKSLKIQQTWTPAYNPKSNPVERAHRTLGDTLKRLIRDRPSQWPELLPAALFSMRTSVCRVTNTTPYRLLFGNDPTTDLDLLFGNPNKQETITAKDRQQNIMAAHRWARENIAQAVRRSRKAYLGKLPKFEHGEYVWLFTPVIEEDHGKKFTRYWSGPWRIESQVNKLTYEISPHPSWARRKNEVVSIDRLKTFRYSSQDDLSKIGMPPPHSANLQMPGDEHAETVNIQPTSRPTSPMEDTPATGLGFTVTVTYPLGIAPFGRVVRQSEPVGTQVPYGTNISIDVV